MIYTLFLIGFFIYLLGIIASLILCAIINVYTNDKIPTELSILSWVTVFTILLYLIIVIPCCIFYNWMINTLTKIKNKYNYDS